MNNLFCIHVSMHFPTSFHSGGEWPKVDFYHSGYVKQEIGFLEIRILSQICDGSSIPSLFCEKFVTDL